MNISRKWLREFVDITATDKEYDSVMTVSYTHLTLPTTSRV